MNSDVLFDEFDRFGAVRNFGKPCFSPDGKWIAYISNMNGQLNLWKQPTAVLDNYPLMPLQLTPFVDHAVRQATISPDGAFILIQVDIHGTEQFQLFLIRTDTEELITLANNLTARYQVGPSPFHPYEPLVVYAANERDPTVFDLYTHNFFTGEKSTLWAGGGTLLPVNFSPDGKLLLLKGMRTNTEHNLYLINLETKKLSRLFDETAYLLPGPFSPDSLGFYLITDKNREFRAAAYFDFKTGLHYLETISWDVEEISVSGNGQYLVLTINEDGYSRLVLKDLLSGEYSVLPELPKGVYSAAINSDGSQVALSISTPTHPSDIFLVTLKTGEVTKMTQSFYGCIQETEMVFPELIRYQTIDGKQIPAYLYKPRNLLEHKSLPVVISVHGGPETQERPMYSYNGLYQYLLSKGIAIFAPNIRGSTGYGKSYQQLLYRNWGEADLKDILHALFFLKELPWVSSNRIGIFGVSYGGYVALSALTKLPDYFAVGVSLYGPCNLLTLIKSAPVFWRHLMKQWIGDPDEDLEILMSRSPINFVDNIRAPLLVIQGSNDPRVNKSESDQLVERLQARGHEVEYLVLENAGHGFTKNADWLIALRTSARWLVRYLA